MGYYNPFELIRSILGDEEFYRQQREALLAIAERKREGDKPGYSDSPISRDNTANKAEDDHAPA